MEFFADYHMHSLYSDGRAPVSEMIQAARDRGLARIALTDHGPGVIGIGIKDAETYARIEQEIQDVTQQLPGIEVLTGAEANVVSLDGDIDLPPQTYNKLDILIIGLHTYVWPTSFTDGMALILNNRMAKLSESAREKAQNDNTKALIAAMERHKPDIISHPGMGLPVHIPEVARACSRWDIAFEVNCGHKYPGLDDVLAVCKEGADFVVNSDAHFPSSVGDLVYGSELLERAGVDAGKVRNAIDSWEKGKRVSLKKNTPKEK